MNPPSYIKWKPASQAPEGTTVWTKIDDTNGVRNVQKLKRQGRLWFHESGDMYVYYTPTHYAEI